jgi:hypothetical protein
MLYWLHAVWEGGYEYNNAERNVHDLLLFVRFEVFTAVIMKNAVFWDVAPCRYFVNRRFGGTYHLHLQGIRNPRAMNQRKQVGVYAGSSLVDFLYPEDRGDTYLRNVG